MPNEKLKSENYNQLGGMNSKISPYMNGPMEFLNLVNLDFQTPGSLQQRWGSTQYLGQTFAGPINSLFEFTRLDGSSHVMLSHSGGLWDGATTGNGTGLSLTLVGVTVAAGQAFIGMVTGVTYNVGGVLHPLPFVAYGVPYLGKLGNIIGGSGTAVYPFNNVGGVSNESGNNNPGDTFIISPQVQSDNTLSYTTFQNNLFMADGNKFLRYDGTTTYPVGLPPGMCVDGLSQIGVPTNGVFGGPSLYGSVLTGASDFLGFGMTGYYAVYCSYVNNRGFEGPLWPILNIVTGNVTSFVGGGFLAYRAAIGTPLEYGISAINQYVYWQSATMIASGTTYLPGITFSGGFNLWSVAPDYVSTTPASGSTFTYVVLGSTIGGQSALISNTLGGLTTLGGYLPLGFTIASVPGHQWQINPYYPSYLETFENRLFLAGFSASPSTIWFSDSGEPEGYGLASNFDVRTNDGDSIKALKSYQTQLYIWKANSFHILTGDNPSNFFLRQISDQYGCVNNRSAVTFKNSVAFLDKKGVMVWNGASVEELSFKIKPILDRMNRSAAITSACAIHDKIRNQILFAIPLDASTTNNMVIVYDYEVGAWTTHSGYTPSAFAAIIGRNNTRNAFYGDTSGRVNWFGSSFVADNGAGYTCYIKTHFVHDMGDSTQKMFRRLWVNTDAHSSTLVFGVNFFQDYGTSVVLGTTIVLGQFQNRIDYGISARSIAFEMSNLQTSQVLRIHGYTVESRFLRKV